MRTYLASIAAASLLAGCGGDDSGNETTATVHCLWVDDLCDEVTAKMSSGQQSALSNACTGGQGAFAVGTCPLTGAVAGHCHYTAGVVEMMTGVAISGATANEYYYSAGGWTSGDAKTYCESPPEGTWVP